MVEKQNKEDEKKQIVAKISFNIPMTGDEARELVNNPKGSLSRKLKQYVNKLVVHAAKQVLDSVEPNVKDCNIPIPEDLKKPTK